MAKLNINKKYTSYITRINDVVGDYYMGVEFPNGYGASIIQSPTSYGGKEGKFELAVTKDGYLDYSTPITEDVVGWCTSEDINCLLGRIMAL